MGFFEKLGQIDTRIIYVLFILAILIPLVTPLGLPVTVSQHTKQTYEIVNSLQPGDTVIIDIGISYSGAGDVLPQTVAMLKHLMAKDVKVIFTGVQMDSSKIIEDLIRPYEEAGKQYGVDFCNLGYLAGGENAIAAYARDLRKAYPLDSRGNSTDTLAILQTVNSAKDANMFIFFSTQNADMYVRQIAEYQVPIVGGLIATIAPQAEPYLHAGQLKGMLVGLRGAAEYETMMESPGIGVASMDAQSIAHLLIIFFIVIANISYFATRGRTQPAKEASQ
jgi:preprotein translocase subunit YajC